MKEKKRKILDVGDFGISSDGLALKVYDKTNDEHFYPDSQSAQTYHILSIKQEYLRKKEFFDLFPVLPSGQFMYPKEVCEEFGIEIKENYWSKDPLLREQGKSWSGDNKKVWVYKSMKIPLEVLAVHKNDLNWIVSIEATAISGGKEATANFEYTGYPSEKGLYFEAFLFIGEELFEGVKGYMKEQFDDGKVLISNDKLKVYMGKEYRKRDSYNQERKAILKNSDEHDIPSDSPFMFSNPKWEASAVSFVRNESGEIVEPSDRWVLGYPRYTSAKVHRLQRSGGRLSSFKDSCTINFFANPDWENQMTVADIAYHHYQTKRYLNMNPEVVAFPKVLVPQTRYGLLNHRIY